MIYVVNNEEASKLDNFFNMTQAILKNINNWHLKYLDLTWQFKVQPYTIEVMNHKLQIGG